MGIKLIEKQFKPRYMVVQDKKGNAYLANERHAKNLQRANKVKILCDKDSKQFKKLTKEKILNSENKK